VAPISITQDCIIPTSTGNNSRQGEKPNSYRINLAVWEKFGNIVPPPFSTLSATMSHHARVEELSDSDPDDMDPSDFDPSRFAKESIISPANIPPSSRAPAPPSQFSSQAWPAPQPNTYRDIPRNFQCLYPVYFDKTRSRAEGRRVGRDLAVENPLARDILDAVQLLGLSVGFEPEKLHPKDWANPGRVRVSLKGADGRPINERVKNSTIFHPLSFYFYFNPPRPPPFP
jgi:signal recognition particle subunit SEC65